MYGFVGIIMLIGIVKKNAIMMIDFAIETERRRRHGRPTRGDPRGGEHAVPADHDDDDGRAHGRDPDRASAGAPVPSARRPLGVVVVGGLAFSQLVTLYVTPVFYTYFDELQTWFGPPPSDGAARVARSPVAAPCRYRRKGTRARALTRPREEQRQKGERRP